MYALNTPSLLCSIRHRTNHIVDNSHAASQQKNQPCIADPCVIYIVPPVQVSASSLFVVLAAHCPDLAPAATILRMATHALDQLEAATESAALDSESSLVVSDAMFAIRHDGVDLQGLDPQTTIDLALRALLYSGAPPRSLRMHVGHPAVPWLHSRHCNHHRGS
jgi:hypothetical protein